MAVAAILAAGPVSGCSTHGLLFRDPGYLKIISPKQGAHLRNGVTVVWRLASSRHAASYAVFLDRAPQAPGDRLPTDRTGIVVTPSTSATFDDVPPKANGVSAKDKRTHELTVILLDGAGRRLGEVEAFVSVVITR